MTEREQLLEEANALGLSFAKNAKTETIKKAVEKAKNEQADEEAIVQAGGEPIFAEPVETEDEMRSRLEAEFAKKLEDEKRKITANMEVNLASKAADSNEGRVAFGQAKLKARREALKLVRVNITCKDPMKSSWEGEIIAVGNDVIGDVKKYIPFNTDNGYHVPQIILNVLKNKNCSVFVNKRVNGQTVQEAKQIKAYNIEYLEPLSQDELSELAREQAARGAVD